MEGREQKYQRIAKYADNTTYQNCWPLIFRHEFIQLIHLRENGYDKINYISKRAPYVPEKRDDHCEQCILKLELEKCPVCDSKYMKKICAPLKFKSVKCFTAF